MTTRGHPNHPNHPSRPPSPAMPSRSRGACGGLTVSGAGGGWGPRRLRGLAAVAVVLLLLVGFGLTRTVLPFLASLTGGRSGDPDAPDRGQTVAGVARRDAIAAAPMLRVRPEDAAPAEPAARPVPAIVIPPATSTGPAGVPSGFAHTPQGAAGQLAAIITTTLTAMSVPLTREVHAGWTAPGAPPVQAWGVMRSVQLFLGAARMGSVKDRDAVLEVVPAAAQIKGTDGRDWVLACVLVKVTAVARTKASIGYGHCERMTWQSGRWVIADGPAPALAPSTWPDTPVAAAAGWQPWTEPTPGDKPVPGARANPDNADSRENPDSLDRSDSRGGTPGTTGTTAARSSGPGPGAHDPTPEPKSAVGGRS